MKTLWMSPSRLALFTMGGIITVLASCSTISDQRHDIAELSQAEYDQLKTKIVSVAEITSSRISQSWNKERKIQALVVIGDGLALLDDPSRLQALNTTNIIRTLVDQYSKKMGLNSESRSYIKDAALLMDVLVGPIMIDVDAKLSERELGLLRALLDGLANGLSR